MIKIMFDSNAFSRLIDSHLDQCDFFAKCTGKYEFYVSFIQVEELAQIGDHKKERRIQHMLCLCLMRAKLVDTLAVLGYSRVGLCVVGDETEPTYHRLLTATQGNVKDAMIGEVAQREGCVLITDDIRFANKLKAESIPTMTFQEFSDSVLEN